MIPLATKLPAICSLLHRVLEMEQKATPGPWCKDWGRVRDDNCGTICVVSDSFHYDQEPWIANAELIAFSRNITKPQATALLGDIAAWQKIAANEVSKPDHWTACHQCESNKELAEERLQSIADAFPDALFQDSSRCA